MKIKLTEGEMSSVWREHLYPDCTHDPDSVNKCFNWARTRQGHTYWEDKFEDPLWPDHVHSETLKKTYLKNVTHSDKVYMSLLVFSSKHRIACFEFSKLAKEGISDVIA